MESRAQRHVERGEQVALPERFLEESQQGTNPPDVNLVATREDHAANVLNVFRPSAEDLRHDRVIR